MDPVDARVSEPRATRCLRVALVTNERLAFGGAATNGFGTRYANVAAAVSARGHELLVVSVGPGRSKESPPWRTDDDDRRRYVAVDWQPSASRARSYTDVVRATLLARTRIGPGRGWERAVTAQLDAFQPDVVAVAAPFRPSLCLLVRRHIPLVFFAEEDLSRLPGRRALRHLHREQSLTHLRYPRVVVAIAEDERPWAKRRWPRSQAVVIPHGIDVDHWAEAVELMDAPPAHAHPAPVFAVGDFGHGRNRDGLLAVGRELDRRSADPELVVGVASAAPLIADRDDPMTRVVAYGNVDDPRRGYAGASAALVPSFQVTGVKTQILQAWAAGCPVVTTTAAAESVSARDRRELLAGATPAEVVDRLEELLTDPELATRLIAEGRRAVHARFSLELLADGVDRALRLAMGQTPE